MATLKKHDQIICTIETGEIYGGATCPFCLKRSTLEDVQGWLCAKGTCEHVSMAVDAGGTDIAIHFIRK
jgi:hypothetical protein